MFVASRQVGWNHRLYMSQFFIRILLAWFIIFPIITLLHELGHGLAAMAVVPDGKVKCAVGTDLQKSIFTLRIGQRLQVLLNFGTGFFGNFYVENFLRLEKGQLILINLAGPLVSLMLAVVFYLLSLLESHYFYDLIWQGALVQFLVTIIPMRYPRWLGGYGNLTSDGLRIWQALQK